VPTSGFLPVLLVGLTKNRTQCQEDQENSCDYESSFFIHSPRDACQGNSTKVVNRLLFIELQANFNTY